MPSIVDIIAKAEADAADIREQAQKDARAVIDSANDTVRANIKSARDRAKLVVSQRKEVSQRAGRRLLSDVYNARARETQRLMDLARTRYDTTVAYIIERVIRG